MGLLQAAAGLARAILILSCHAAALAEEWQQPEHTHQQLDMCEIPLT